MVRAIGGRPARHRFDVVLPGISAVWGVAIGVSDDVPARGGLSGTSDFSSAGYSRQLALDAGRTGMWLTEPALGDKLQTEGARR